MQKNYNGCVYTATGNMECSLKEGFQRPPTMVQPNCPEYNLYNKFKGTRVKKECKKICNKNNEIYKSIRKNQKGEDLCTCCKV
jgi:hypothetical protein